MKKRVKKLKLKKEVKVFAVVLVILIIVTIFGVKKYQEYKYHQTYEYKLLQKEYNMDEVKILLEKLDDDYLNKLLEEDYNKNIPKILNEKYFLRKNLDKYLDYLGKNPKTDISDVVALVNVHRDSKFYDQVYPTDTSKDTLMLVNKYYHLEDNYVPENLTNISLSYAYAGNSCRKDVMDAFINMAEASYNEGIVLIVNSSYRSFEDQKQVWEAKKRISGTNQADAYAARAGFSEHQSGLALDVNEYKSTEEDFEKTQAFQWLQDNAYKYGFILRYPKDKENITGYSYESWHYRYVGEEVATKLRNEGITFEEYYAYYVEE